MEQRQSSEARRRGVHWYKTGGYNATLKLICMGGKILQNRSNSRLKSANKKNTYTPHRREVIFEVKGEIKRVEINEK